MKAGKTRAHLYDVLPSCAVSLTSKLQYRRLIRYKSCLSPKWATYNETILYVKAEEKERHETLGLKFETSRLMTNRFWDKPSPSHCSYFKLLFFLGWEF